MGSIDAVDLVDVFIVEGSNPSSPYVLGARFLYYITLFIKFGTYGAIEGSRVIQVLCLCGKAWPDINWLHKLVQPFET